MMRFLELIKQRWLKDTFLTVLLVAIIILVYLLVNAGVQALNLRALDFTASQLYTLSDASKNIVKDIEQNVDIYFWGYNSNESAVDIGRQYHDVNEKINIQIVDYNSRPDLAASFGANSAQKLVIVVSNQRTKLINSTDMYTYDYSTFEQIDLTEQKITNAIMDVTLVKKQKVYFLSGHEEFSISDSGDAFTFGATVENEIYEITKLNLITNESVPEDCDLLVIINVKKDFTTAEKDKLITYIQNGGDILWFQNPDIINGIDIKSFSNVSRVLEEYGVTLDSGLVCEKSADYQSLETGSYNQPGSNLIVPQLNYNSVVKDLYTDGQLIMLNAGRITNNEEKNYLTYDPFVVSSDTSYYKSGDKLKGKNADLTVQDEDDEVGPFVIGERVTRSTLTTDSSELIIFSNALFISDYVLSSNTDMFFNLGNNKDMALNSVAYLTERQESVRIRKAANNVSFTSATVKDARIVLTIITSVPIIIILVGIIVPIVRRRRK